MSCLVSGAEAGCTDVLLARYLQPYILVIASALDTKALQPQMTCKPIMPFVGSVHVSTRDNNLVWVGLVTMLRSKTFHEHSASMFTHAFVM